MSILIKRQRPSNKIQSPTLKYGELGVDQAGTLYVGGLEDPQTGNLQTYRQIGEKGGVVFGPLKVEDQNSIFKGKAFLDSEGKKINDTYLTIKTSNETPKDPILPPDPSRPIKKELTPQNVFTFVYGEPLIYTSQSNLSTITTPGNYYCRDRDSLSYIKDFPKDLDNPGEQRCSFVLKIFSSNGEISSNENNREITQMLFPSNLKNLVYYRRLKFVKISTSESWNIDFVKDTDLYGWIHPLTKTLSQDNFAKKNHASVTTDFGLGNKEKYGHLKLSDEIKGVAALDKNGGVAATPYAVEKVQNGLNTLNSEAVKINLEGSEAALQAAGINADTLEGHAFNEFLLSDDVDRVVKQKIYQHLNQVQADIIKSWQNIYDTQEKKIDIFDFSKNLNDELSTWLPKKAFYNSRTGGQLQDALSFDFSNVDNPVNKPQIVVGNTTNAPQDLAIGVRSVTVFEGRGYTAVIQGIDKRGIPALWSSAGLWTPQDVVKNLSPWRRVDNGGLEQTRINFYQTLSIENSLSLPGLVKIKVDPATAIGSMKIDFLCKQIPNQILRDDLISNFKLFEGIKDYYSSGSWEWQNTKVEIINGEGQRVFSSNFLIFTNGGMIASTEDFQNLSFPQRNLIYQQGNRIRISIEKINFAI